MAEKMLSFFKNVSTIIAQNCPDQDHSPTYELYPSLTSLFLYEYPHLDSEANKKQHSIIFLVLPHTCFSQYLLEHGE